ncbi:MAG: Mu transposase domain-containing protein [Nocardioidaceae bacterium]
MALHRLVWWRTVADDATVESAQAGLDRWCARVGDARKRRRDGQPTTVADLAAAEPLAPVPAAPYPATIEVTRVVSAQSLVAFRGNVYSVPPGMTGRQLIVTTRLGDTHLQVATEAGVVLARHRRASDGVGAVVRDAGHVTALEKAVLAGFTDRPSCRGKTRRPPSPAALAEAARIRGDAEPAAGRQSVVDFAAYAAAVRPVSPTSDAAEEPGGEAR